MRKRLLGLLMALLLLACSVQPEVYAAGKNSSEELYETGMKYFNENNYSSAFSYFQISGEIKGYAPSQNMLGVCYRDGLGVEKNANEAERYFKLASEQGDPDATQNLSTMHKAGPQITSLTLDSTNQPVITWSEVPGAEYYKLFRARGDGGFASVCNSKGLNYTSPSYALGADTYTFKVQAVFSDGAKSDFSEPKTITIPVSLGVPKISFLSCNEKNQPVVKWSAVAGASKYELFRSEDNKTYNKVGVTEKTEYTVLTCRSDHSYYFKVRALSADGTEGQFSNIRSIAVPIPTPSLTYSPKPTPTPKGYVGTAKGSYSGEKVYLNDSRNGIFELDEPIRNCRSLTMNLRFYNFEGHPEGMYYLYGRSESGHWNQLGEFELSSNKNNTQVKQTFEFKEEKHVSITAFAIALHERNRAYTGSWSFSNSMEITDVYVYE